MRGSTVLAFLWLVLLGAPASAAGLVKIEVTGHITSGIDTGGRFAAVGTDLTGRQYSASITYDPGATTSIDDYPNYRLFGGGRTFSFKLGGSVYSYDSIAGFQVNAGVSPGSQADQSSLFIDYGFPNNDYFINPVGTTLPRGGSFSFSGFFSG